jgi:hypothetical protein
VNHEHPARASRKSEKPRTPDELERAIEAEIASAILQGCLAHQLYHAEVIPILRKNGVSEYTISALNNASLESQLLFLRKLNEFFEQLPKEKDRPLKEDDLRAEHYFGFKSPGPFLKDSDEKEIHKRVGHITLIEVRHGPKDWAELVKSSLPIAVDGLLEFFRFLYDSDQLSNPSRKHVQFYIERLDHIKELLNHKSGEVPATGVP